MELKEFITETLTQIIEGVKSAQEKSKDTGALINPADTKAQENTPKTTQNDYIGLVDFGVALTQIEGKEGKSGIGVYFAGIGFGGQQKTDTQNMSVTNIKFSIPVIFPQMGEKVVVTSEKAESIKMSIY